MTLTTHVAIGAPTDVKELFGFCRQLLGAPADLPVEHDYKGSVRKIANPGGVGLPAWLEIEYGADGPLPVHVHDKWCPRVGDEYGAGEAEVLEHAAEIAADPLQNGWAAIDVSLDTTYSYRGEDGASCSDLHARLVLAIGHFCDARGLPWKWQDEFLGSWHDGEEGLAEFGDAFASTGAKRWFEQTVVPAIAGRV